MSAGALRIEPAPLGQPRTWNDYVWQCWESRPCWICKENGKDNPYGRCAHRQPEAESVAVFRAAIREQRP